MDAEFDHIIIDKDLEEKKRSKNQLVIVGGTK